MSGVNEIRSAFLDYFRKNGHEVVASSPLVPRNDPTLMFTNAGMVQFKNVFTGLEQRPYSRAATSQKCVRAGGKHNDLDNVGYTARHHTFFEMLGNFSFGDYFKERAIELAWNLITKEFGLAKDRLTGHRLSHRRRGGRLLEEDRRPARGAHHPHRRPPTISGRWATPARAARARRSSTTTARSIPGGPPGSPDEDGDRFIEIWNLVFMQFEQVTKEERIDLPRPSIDTGMGLERIAAVLQGEHDNYDIDLFRALIRASEEATGVKAEGKNRASHRVIADHLRASSFLIADGVLPSNEGRGYVLRRIMRRAMRHAQLLGAAEPLMWRLVPALVREMGQAYPELVRGEALITETLKLEETRFRKTLARGLGLLDEATDTLGDRRQARRRDRVQALRHLRLPARPDAGRAAPARHRRRYRRLQRRDGAAEGRGARQLGRLRRGGDRDGLVRLRDKAGATEFLGYDTEKAEGIVAALVQRRRRSSTSAERRRDGRRRRQPDAVLRRVRRPDGRHRHDLGRRFPHRGHRHAEEGRRRCSSIDGKVAKGTVKTGEAVELEVDHARRTRLRANHSATHLLHEALREVLGTHVAQKGSLVAPDRLRFDFSHPKPISAEELEQVERLANEIVLQNSPVDDAADVGRRRDRRGRDGAVRREIRRRGARRLDGHGDRTATRPASPIRSSCAAAPMSAPPATSAWSGSSPKARSRPACAASRR